MAIQDSYCKEEKQEECIFFDCRVMNLPLSFPEIHMCGFQ